MEDVKIRTNEKSRIMITDNNGISKKEFTYRNYKEGDEKEIILLLKSVFKSPKFDDEKYWNWLHKDNPAKMSKISVVEYDRKIIGHCGLVPAFMMIDNKLQIGFYAANIAVHQNYRRLGIFSNLWRHAYNSISKEESPIIYCYPSKLTFPWYIKKSGWFEIPCLPMLYKPLDLKYLLRAKIKNKYLLKAIRPLEFFLEKIFFRNKKYISDGLEIKKVAFLDDKIDELWKNASKGKKIITVRDKRYLTWRYLKNPKYNFTIFTGEREGKILGYIVIRLFQVDKYSKGSMIVDFLTLPGRDDVLHDLIIKAIQYCKEEGAYATRCYIQDKYYYNFLRKMGFIQNVFEERYMRLCAKNLKDEDMDLFYNIENWYITAGDLPTEI